MKVSSALGLLVKSCFLPLRFFWGRACLEPEAVVTGSISSAPSLISAVNDFVHFGQQKASDEELRPLFSRRSPPRLVDKRRGKGRLSVIHGVSSEYKGQPRSHSAVANGPTVLKILLPWVPPNGNQKHRLKAHSIRSSTSPIRGVRSLN